MMAMLRTSARRASTRDTSCRPLRAASIQAGSPAREGVCDLTADIRDHRAMIFAGPARDRCTDPYPHPGPERNRQEVAREEPPGVVDRDRDDGRIGSRL